MCINGYFKSKRNLLVKCILYNFSFDFQILENLLQNHLFRDVKMILDSE